MRPMGPISYMAKCLHSYNGVQVNTAPPLTAQLTDYARRHGVPVPLSIAIFQGAVLAFYGSVALISLAVPLTPEMRTATLALGGFWIALGILSFAWAIGVVRHPAMWLTLNNFLPAMLAIVAFGWMAFQLGKLQAETSRAVAEPIRFEGAVEVQQ